MTTDPFFIPFIIIHALKDGTLAAINVAVFFVLFRSTSLAGFRLLFLASAANLGLHLFSVIGLTTLARLVEPSVIGYINIAQGVLSLAVWIVWIVGGILVLRSYLPRTQIREAAPERA